ncbi:MAG: hypothetical protein K0R09_591 [Clostridiales bacterium]|nr:hypothetical protein [Clostridiales bacterium]
MNPMILIPKRNVLMKLKVDLKNRLIVGFGQCALRIVKK